MNIKNEKLYVGGMVCNSCEKIIEKKLRKLAGVKYAKADYQKSQLLIKYDAELCDKEKINNVLNKYGYSINSKKASDKKTELFSIIGIIAAAFLILKLGQNSGNFNISDNLDGNVGFIALFIIGLLSSLHCVGMCGGIMMSQSITIDRGSKIENLKPSLKYNIGRLISYIVLGGIVGGIGQVISLSLGGQAIIAFTAGAFMVIMGLNMYGFKGLRMYGFKILKKFNIKMSLGKCSGKFNIKLPFGKCSKKNKFNTPFIVGLLNGFMPCGPLQTMQLYALASGSILKGAMSMFFFALGTIPLMMIFGLIANSLSQKNSSRLVKISGLIVIVLGLSMASRGLTLLGVNTPDIGDSTSPVTSSTNKEIKGSKAEIVDGKQIVRLSANAYGYTPKEIYIQKNMPTELIIEGDRITSCNNEIIIPSMNVRKKLSRGTNTITITAEDNNINYSCWMGMKRGVLKVVDDLSIVNDSEVVNNTPVEPEAQFYGMPVSKVPTDRLVRKAELADNMQKINVTSTAGDFEPAVILLNDTNETVINYEMNDNKNDGRYTIVNGYFSKTIASFEIIDGKGTSNLPRLESGIYGIMKNNRLYSIIEVYADVDGVDKELIRKKYF